MKWIILILILLMVAVIVLAYLRVRYLREQSARDIAVQALIAESRLDALQSQMNPHFIFNAITAIQSFILQNKREEAVEYLGDFAELIRQTLNFSRRDTISLADELKLLDVYISLEKMRFQDSFFYDIELDLVQAADEIQIPPMLLQPYVENAIRHGLRPKKTAGHVWIRLKEENDILICEVEDDGVGREKARELNAWRTKPKHESVGMEVTYERLAILNQIHSKKLKAEVIDLYNEQKKASGTLVRVSIPL